MPALQVRDFPEDLYSELKLVAKENGRSISAQTVVILREYLESQKAAEAPKRITIDVDGSYALPPREDPEYHRARLEKLYARIRENSRPEWADLPDPAEIVREGREERTNRILEVGGWQL